MTDHGTKRHKTVRFLVRPIVHAIAHPFLSAIEATLAIVTGLVGSIYSSDLKAWIAAIIAPPDGSARKAALPTDPVVKIFWTLLVVTVLLHVGRTLAKQRQEAKTQKEFNHSVAKIQDLVATNGSPDYVKELGLAFEKSYLVCSAADTISDKKRALTNILGWIAKLAQIYDNNRRDSPSAIFVANAMWFVPHEHAAGWDSFVAFRPTGTTLGGVRGVLALPSYFVATTDSDGVSKMPNFALDVPTETGNPDKGWSVLPGAPFAFINKRFEHFHPAPAIASWMEKYGDFAPSTREKVGRYFTQNAEIAGFLSLPVFVPTAQFVEHVDREVLGVLNIHWSGADILDRPETAQRFTQTIYPLSVLVSKLMDDLKQSEGWPSPT